MHLKLGNVYATVESATDDERLWLFDALTFKDPRVHYVKALRGKDMSTKLFNPARGTFPAGLVPVIVKKARAAGFDVSWADPRVREAPDPNADLAWLRDYQLDAVKAVEKRRRGILWIPTGGGKTEVAVGLLRRWPNKRWLFLAHKKGLMHQAFERYERRRQEHSDPAPPAGRCGDGIWEPGERVTFATYQTLSARKTSDACIDLLRSTTGVIADEAHTVPANSTYGIVMGLPNADIRIGVSGTPLDRGDKRSLLTVASLGPTIFRLRPEVLIERGVLARPHIRMMRVHQDLGKPSWQGLYGSGVVRSTVRNRAIIEAVQRSAKPCLVFVKQVNHGKELVQRLRRAGVPAEFTWGSKDQASRERAIHRLVHGDTDALVCSVIFQEGIDIPELASVVIASGGKSVIAAIQRVGRGMRVVEGKDTFEVWDIFDTGTQTLERHARARERAYIREGYDVVVEGDQLATP